MCAQSSKNLICIPLSITNVYLIPCQGGYLQVDTGFHKDYPAYRKALHKLGVQLSDIKYLFLTHHHDDHAGFLNELASETQLTIIANQFSTELLLTGKNDTTHGLGWVSPMVETTITTMRRLDPQWEAGFPPFRLREQDICIEGDNFEILRKIGIAGDILYTPGHCLDHQVLLLDVGELICGDAASSAYLFAGTHYCTFLMSDMETAYQSWQKMLDAGAQTIHPAHGDPFSAARLQENMGKIKTRDLILQS